MASPVPPSDPDLGLFFPEGDEYDADESQATQTLDTTVNALLASARSVQKLDDTLQAVFVKHRKLLLDVMNRQIRLIASRSQVFEDAQVTIFDKVLLELTADGNEDAVPAVTWFCKQYFGYNPELDAKYNTQAIQQGIAVPVALTQGSQEYQEPQHRTFRDNHPKSHDRNHVQDHDHDNDHHKDARNDMRRRQRRSRTPSPVQSSNQNNVQDQSPTMQGVMDDDDVNSAIQADTNLSRLWTVYQEALVKYYSVADEGSFATRDAAKWLRDTAENGMHYLNDKKSTAAIQRVRAELDNTYRMTQKTVEKLTGGRKRKFDHEANLEQTRYVSGTRDGDRGREIDRYRSSWRDVHRDSNKPLNQRKELFPQKVWQRGNHEIGRSRDVAGGLGQSQSRGQGQNRARDGRQQNHGRGHSGIPYGYNASRPVDSYVPGRH